MSKNEYEQEAFDRMKHRLMTLHQEKLNSALAPCNSVMLDNQEVRDLCEFMSMFLYSGGEE